MKENKTKHIVIIGAGPAGLTLAHLLSKSKFKVSIIDKNTAARRKVCGEYLCPKGVSLIKQLGLSHTIEDFHKVWGMKIVSPNQTSLTSFFPCSDEVSTYGVSLNRQSFDQRLRNLLEQESNIHKYYGETFLSIERKDESWEIETTNYRLKADIVIGADGINSLLAKKLNHRKETKSKRLALHAYLKLKNPSLYSRVGQMHLFNDGAYCGLNPINVEEINFSIVCDSKKMKGLKPYELINEYLASSNQLSKMFSPLEPSDKVFSLCPISLVNSVISTDSIAYVGDAAGFIDPLTGEGIYNSLLSAKQLADNLCTHQEVPVALKSYKKEKIKATRAKNILNTVFQGIIRRPYLANLIAKFLKKNQVRANSFVGIIGNIYTPLEGFTKMLITKK